ncbi:MAG: SUMF1/EgtB/PvdO family nonheme iron enzyme [Anaerolineales bacterium]|nr:SUMF1/EgtB/PvdO family nonheme iron enzyme [Anaerolineales bacterium]
MEELNGKTLLHRYSVLELIGRGGMAEVYKVWDQERSVHLAMKVLHEELAIDRVFMRRFQREAQTLAQLQHPNIVRFYSLEHDGDLAFMLLDYVEGRSLKRVIYDQGGSLPFGRVLTISQQVLSALGYAHNKGFVHADIKPGNILIDGQGTAYVTDFGIARMTDAATMTMAGAGTPAYMAPEAIRGLPPTPAVDQYGWGVVLFEMLTGGERPFTGERATLTGTVGERVRWEHLNLDPPTMSRWSPDITPALEAVVGRCLAKEPAKRFPGVPDLLAALSEAGDEMPEEEFAEEPAPPHEAPAEAFEEPQAAPRVRKMGLWVALAVVVVAALGWGAVLLMGGGGFEAAQSLEMHSATQNLTGPDEAVVPPEETPAEVPATATMTPMSTITPTPTLEAGARMISPVDGMELVYIPAGSFKMGLDGGILDQEPAHDVQLDAYWMDRTEVTNAMYAQCVEAGSCNPPAVMRSYTRDYYFGSSEYENYPVLFVSWYDAQDYCFWTGRRLPTEAEWERAARGDDGRMYPWGNDVPTCELADFAGCGADTSEVGSHPDGASVYGVHDLAGNVGEWVGDWYEWDYYASSEPSNPTGPISGEERVTRGGDWSDSASVLRSTNRVEFGPRGATNGSGIRCAMSADAATEMAEALHVRVETPEPVVSPQPDLELGAGDSTVSEIDGMEMMYIPAGLFMMGSDRENVNAQPVHEVFLDAYLIDQTEVTNDMYAAFLNAMGNQEEDGVMWLDAQDDTVRIVNQEGIWTPTAWRGDHPVVEVTWYGAQAYCEWAGRRLPTEAEWERAARGDDSRTYPWGESEPTCALAAYWTCVGSTSRVGSHQAGASPFGVQDMAGNVEEWIADRYAENYYGQSPADNPPGATTGDRRVARDGSWWINASVLEAYNRHSYEPTVSMGNLGFRCAMSAGE